MVAVLLSVLWYGLVWLFFYRRKNGPYRGVVDDGLTDVEEVFDDGLLGRPVLSEGEKLVSSSDFGFAGTDAVEQLGVVADVQEEIKRSCRELESRLAVREEFLSVLASVLASYQLPTSAKAPLEDFIREHLPFFISSEELDSLWS